VDDQRAYIAILPDQAVRDNLCHWQAIGRLEFPLFYEPIPLMPDCGNLLLT